MSIKVLSLFSGIGAFEKGLINAGVDFELVNYCDNNKIASKAYSVIHNVSEDLNLGDITKINIDDISTDIDLITHGSPCTSFSLAGKQGGGDEGSGTQSSLMWNTVKIVKHCKPKYVIWENVKNVLSKKHKHNFDKYLNELSNIGYTNYYKVINSTDVGTPMNRERIFIISILGSHDKFEFPVLNTNITNIKCYLEHGLSDINVKVASNIKPGCQVEFLNHYNNIINHTKSGYDCKAKSDFQDKKVGITISYCIRANNSNTHILDNLTIRKLTSREFWRLINFSDYDYDLVKNKLNYSNNSMCKLAGNSIDVNIITLLMKQLFNKKITKNTILYRLNHNK